MTDKEMTANRFKRAIPALSLYLMAMACHADTGAELMFDHTKFVFKTSQKSTTGPGNGVTHSYEAQGENKHRCVLLSHPRPKTSVAAIMNVDKAVMKPPITIAPLEQINQPSQKYKDDALSIIVTRSNEGEGLYTVILHRATQVQEELVRELQIECTLSYGGFFGKSLSDFERVKANWIADAFAMDPELPSAPDAK